MNHMLKQLAVLVVALFGTIDCAPSANVEGASVLARGGVCPNLSGKYLSSYGLVAIEQHDTSGNTRFDIELGLRAVFSIQANGEWQSIADGSDFYEEGRATCDNGRLLIDLRDRGGGFPQEERQVIAPVLGQGRKVIDYFLEDETIRMYEPSDFRSITEARVESGGSPYIWNTTYATPLYDDADGRFTKLPDHLLSRILIAARNADRLSSAPDYLSFRIPQASEVYVMFDDRVETLPAWLTTGGWQRRNEFQASTSIGERRAYGKTFSAGVVVLGGNGMPPASFPSGGGNYTVIVVPITNP